MDKRVLVAYGSKYGATAGIAEKIGEILRQAGLQVDVAPVRRAGDPAAYSAVVLGSAVYGDQWRKEAAKFLVANEKKLAKLPVWLFSSGPTGEGDPVEVMKGWRLPKEQQAIADRIRPRGVALFRGSIDINKLTLVEMLSVKGIKVPTGDFRDWEAITAWAEGIASAVQ